MPKLSLPLVLLGLLGSAAIATPAKAQSFDPFPPDTQGCVVVNYICRSILDDGEPSLAAIPTGYDGRYLVSVRRAGVNNLALVYDLQNEQISAYMFVNSQGRLENPLSNGYPGIGGEVQLLDENVAEIVFLLAELRRFR
jgi:hypothetical protein